MPQGKVFFIKIMVIVISQDIMMQIGLVVWMIRHSKSGYSVKSRSRISRYALPTRDMLFIHSLVQETDFSVSMPRQLHHDNHVALHFESRLTQTYKAHLVVSMSEGYLINCHILHPQRRSVSAYFSLKMKYLLILQFNEEVRYV